MKLVKNSFLYYFKIQINNLIFFLFLLAQLFLKDMQWFLFITILHRKSMECINAVRESDWLFEALSEVLQQIIKIRLLISIKKSMCCS